MNRTSAAAGPACGVAIALSAAMTRLGAPGAPGWTTVGPRPAPGRHDAAARTARQGITIRATVFTVRKSYTHRAALSKGRRMTEGGRRNAAGHGSRIEG